VRTVILLASLLMTSSVALAQALPILRGIVVTHSGVARAYFENPHTGALGAYAPGDLVGDSQIEAIYDDRVVLRRGGDLVHVLMGSSSPTISSETTEVGRPPDATAASPVAAVYQPDPTARPIIGNGQPWLDRLGIPPQALSRAIEQALPAQDSDGNIKD
jgi:hypothetical protein